MRIVLFGEDATRDFTYVDDVVRALMEAERATGATVNVATGTECSIRTVAERIVASEGADEARIVLGERRSWDRVVRRFGDVTRMRELYGWVPSTPFDEGLRQTLAWLREDHRDRGGAR